MISSNLLSNLSSNSSNNTGDQSDGDKEAGVKLRRYFVAVLPTETIQGQTNDLKRELGRVYDCKPVWNSPPHVTLLPPFERSPQDLPRFEQWLRQATVTFPKFELAFEGLGAFPPRVLFVDVVRSPTLMQLQQTLKQAFETHEAPYESPDRPDPKDHGRSYSPHMTLARCRPKRKRGKNPFHDIWPEICDRPFQATSPIDRVILLEYLNRQWEVCKEYPLA